MAIDRHSPVLITQSIVTLPALLFDSPYIHLPTLTVNTFLVSPSLQRMHDKPKVQHEPPPCPESGFDVTSVQCLRFQRGSILGDLCHRASLSGSVSVGSFYYRKQTLTKVGCVFVLLCFSLCGFCGRAVCMCTCVCACMLR